MNTFYHKTWITVSTRDYFTQYKETPQMIIGSPAKVKALTVPD